MISFFHKWKIFDIFLKDWKQQQKQKTKLSLLLGRPGQWANHRATAVSYWEVNNNNVHIFVLIWGKMENISKIHWKNSFFLPFRIFIMINYLGIFSIIVFYLLILGVGMWAARKKGGEEMDQEVNYTEILMRKVNFKSNY